MNKTTNKAENRDKHTGLEVAVIGMAGRFPGARTLSEFWENLQGGVESLAFLTEEELERLPREIRENPNYVKAKGGVLEDKAHFDAAFFDYIPIEAELMDPQMRLLHECAWEALEDAAYDAATYQGTIGLYAGSSFSIYWEGLGVLSGKRSRFGDFLADQLTNKDFTATRIAYKLNLKGPAIMMQTTCSTSLVAIHLAYRALLLGECKMALAGGLSVTHQEETGYMYTEGMVNSADGHCRAFAADANGTVFGSGGGVVMLKPLKKALADNDHIYAVIKGSAVNNDGDRKVGYTAPSVKGQAEVIRAAHRFAKVEAETITYIETHGTATALGDPIEVQALTRAFNTDKRHFCSLGSVKTNVGHLDCGAGVAGFIKTVLALKNRLIPPSLHFREPNPKIDFENSPFFVAARPIPWKSSGSPLRAGVSAFGIGGTNAHIVLEEWSGSPAAAVADPVSPEAAYQLIRLSARTVTALDNMTRRLADHLRANPGLNLADVAYTLHIGRKTMECRRFAVCSGPEHTVRVLADVESEELLTFQGDVEKTPVVFMFSGQGAQYVNMGLGLYHRFASFREDMDRGFVILESLLQRDMKPVLYPGSSGGGETGGASGAGGPGGAGEAGGNPGGQPGGAGIDDVYYSGPVKFLLEYSLARLLMQWGIQPAALIGHSFGEYVVACLSGVFSLEDGLKLAVLRGRLMEKTPPGRMLSVPLPETQLKPLLLTYPEISLAAVNSPSLCIVSGPGADVERFAARMKEAGHECILLNFPRASHSRLMEPILEEFTRGVREVAFHKPQIPYISGLSGEWLHEEAMDPLYWARHLKETNRFSDGLTRLLTMPRALFLEVGPGRGLTLFLSQHPDKNENHRGINLLRHPREQSSDVEVLLEKLGECWLYGADADPLALAAPQQRHRISLPTYPFEKEHFWMKADYSGLMAGLRPRAAGTRKRDLADWFYIPSWKPAPLVKAAAEKPGQDERNTRWLIFLDDTPLGLRLADYLHQSLQMPTSPANNEILQTLLPGVQGAPWHGVPIMALRDILRLTELFAAGVEAGKFAAGLIKMSEGHLGLIARSQELRAILKSPPGRRRQIIVRPGTAFVKEDSGSYRVNPANKQDYQWLLEDLTREDQLPGQILHLWSLTADTDPPETPGEDPGFAWVDRTQERGLFSLFYLAQAMGAAGMADPLNLHVISAGLQSVWGEELRNPAKSTLLSAIKVIPREFAHITCRSIDVVLPAPGSRQEEQLLRQLRQELEMTEPEIAYRGQQRLVRHFEPLRLPRPPAGETLLKENGVYLVTGGLGGIGLELSQFIAEQVKPRLILTGRSPFPPAAEWDRWLETHDETDPVSVKIGKIRCLEELGADVRVFQADLADDRAMQAVIRQVQEQYGGIRGVIHASGIPGGGAMLRQSRERLEEVLAAKVKGTLILQQLLENEALDFMICCSSASSLLPEFGELAYAAANLFLDAFAHYNHTVNGRFTVSINWGRWRGRGFSVKIEEEHRKRTGQEMSGGMTPGEGKQAFHRILENRIPQLVVLESDFLRQVKAYGQPPPSGEPGPRKPPATPGAKRPRLKTPYVAPQTRMEQQLASLFQQFFGYDRVGIDDDFFDLGGDSLKATVLVTNIHRELNIKIPLATLFLSPTIRELAASGRDLKKERFNTIEAVEKREYYPLSSAQKRLYFLEQFENLGTSYNVPLIIKIQSQPDLGEFERIMGSLIRRHETLRTSFVIIDGDPMQVVFDKVDFILEHLPVKEKKITMEVVQAKIRAFIRRFDLARAPLMRVGIALLSKHEYLLLFDVHHIIADGTSMEFLIDEFTKLSTGKGLPPLKLQYKDFSQWQNRLFESGGIKSQEKFWLEMYADLKEIPRLKLPADYPRSRTLSFAGDHWEFSLSAEETGIFKAVTAQWDVTYYMNLLAVFYVLLYKYTGQEDIVVGGGIMGRSHAELARVFGFFVNALALRNRPRGDKTFAGFLEEVKQTAINAFDNQDFQFEDLVDRLGLQRDPSRNPLFDVLFVFQNFEKAEATQDFLKAESSRISSIPFENRSAKFDLHLIADMIGERLYLAFEYSTTLFKQSTIREMAENFKEIFRQVMENPSVRLKEIKTVNPLLAAKPALSREEGDFEF